MMMRRKGFWSLTGFTLSELLLAAAILVFVLAGLLALFLNCSVLNEANRNLTVATSHAQYVMEEIKNESGLANIKNKINTEGTWDVNTIINKGLQALPSESIAICCCSPPCSGTNPCVSCPATGDLLGVSVTVTWRDRRLRNRNTNLVTLIAER